MLLNKNGKPLGDSTNALTGVDSESVRRGTGQNRHVLPYRRRVLSFFPNYAQEYFVDDGAERVGNDPKNWGLSGLLAICAGNPKNIVFSAVICGARCNKKPIAEAI